MAWRRPRRFVFVLALAWLLALFVASPGVCTEPASSTESASPTSSAPAPPTVAALMERLSGSGGVRAHFVETRRLRILMEPIETRGHLLFAPPDRMVRVTDAPMATRVSVHGRHVAWASEAGTRSLVLSKDDVAATLISDLMMLLGGDLAELERRHSIEFEAKGGAWSLVLTPRDSRVAEVIGLIRASGRGDRVERVEIVEQNGDTTSTHFDAIETGLDLTRTDLEAAFEPDAEGAER